MTVTARKALPSPRRAAPRAPGMTAAGAPTPAPPALPVVAMSGTPSLVRRGGERRQGHRVGTAALSRPRRSLTSPCSSVGAK